jgi:hypothetical protein
MLDLVGRMHALVGVWDFAFVDLDQVEGYRKYPDREMSYHCANF